MYLNLFIFIVRNGNIVYSQSIKEIMAILIVMKFKTKYLQSAFILLRHSILQRDSEQNIQENYPKGFKEDFILQLIRFSI